MRENCTSRLIERTEGGPHSSTSSDSTVGARESRAHGEGPQLIGSLVATLLDAKAWESWPMPAEREMGCKSNRRGPCAVQVACTVPTGDGKTQFGCASCPYALEYCIGGTWGIPLLHCSLGPKAANFWT